jgi:arylsulfatase A-like enzyme
MRGWLGLFLAVGCRQAGSGDNVLLIVMDDVGVDKIGVYGVHPAPPPTPNIDALAARGQRFTSAWAYPVCSPTRAALLTGQHARRHGIGTRISPNVDSWELHPGEVVTLPQLLEQAPEPWDTSFIGKWHLSAGLNGFDPAHHPLLHGFAWSEGSLANLYAALTDEVPFEQRGYTAWEEIRNGAITWKETYATTEAVDDALDRARTMQEPWLLWVALPSIHTPLHTPPRELYPGPEPTTDLERIDAMVEAMDAEIGRLIRDLPARVAERTTIVLVGDNGTESHGIAPPLDPTRDKGTVYEGGVRVPLVVAGPRVRRPGSVSDALVHVVDLLPTVAELAGVDTGSLTLDGQSWLPLLDDPGAPGAEHLFVESFVPLGPGPYTAGSMAVRDADYKYVRHLGGGEELYALSPEASDEGEDLLAGGELSAEAERAWVELAAVLDDTLARIGEGPR